MPGILNQGISSIAPAVTYGTTVPTVKPTDRRGDSYLQTITGTAAGALTAEWRFDGVGWYQMAAPVDRLLKSSVFVDATNLAASLVKLPSITVDDLLLEWETGTALSYTAVPLDKFREQTRCSPSNPAGTGGNIPAGCQVFSMSDGNWAGSLTLPPIDIYSETLVVTSVAGFASSVATTRQIAGAVAVPIVKNVPRVFYPSTDGWIAAPLVIPATDDIVDVTGATLPITFPIATIPGTPVFNPATPTSTTAIYAITNGAAIEYAKWSGTQYISEPVPPPSPSNSFHRAGTGTLKPDGLATDTTRNISRIGKQGFGIIDPTTLNATIDLTGTIANRQSKTTNNTAAILLVAAGVEVSSSVQITQTTVDAVLTIDTPSSPTLDGRILTIHNSDRSTHKIVWDEFEIYPGKFLDLQHNTRGWQIDTRYIDDWEGFDGAVVGIDIPAYSTGTTSYVDVPGAALVMPAPGDYLFKVHVFASQSGVFSPGRSRNDVKLVTTGDVAGSFVKIYDGVTSAANSYVRYAKVRVMAAGQVVKLQVNSVIGSTSILQAAATNSRLSYQRYQMVPIAGAVTVVDNRTINALPSTYGVGAYREFKTIATMLPAVAGLAGTYLSLETVRQYGVGADFSGGQIRQEATFDDGRVFYRMSVNASTWGVWIEIDPHPKTRDVIGYSIGAGMRVNTFNDNIGTNVPGVGYQLPNTVENWGVFNANFVSPIILPATSNATGRISIYPNNDPTFPTIIKLNNTDLPKDYSVPAGIGRSIHFRWNTGGYWQWLPFPTDVINGGTRVKMRGTYAAPLTGAIAVTDEDCWVNIGNLSTTTLPNPAINGGRSLVIKKPGGGSAVVNGLIDNLTTLTLTGANEALTITSDGATWMRS